MSRKYHVTQHAIERYWQRVHIGKTRNDMYNWISQAIENGIFINTDEEEQKHYYRFNEYKIVLSFDNKVITISYYYSQDLKEFKKDINAAIIKKFKKQLKPYLKIEKDTLINMYETKIKRLKARSPKIKETLDETIEELERDLKNARHNINDILKISHKYYLTKKDLIEE